MTPNATDANLIRQYMQPQLQDSLRRVYDHYYRTGILIFPVPDLHEQQPNTSNTEHTT